MTQTDLTQAYKKAKARFNSDGFSGLWDEEIETLCLYSAWEDGADWDTVLELEKNSTYMNRQFAIDQLKNVFGYMEA